MSDVTVQIAIITGLATAVPATLASLAALIKAKQASDQLTPSNGTRLAKMVEEMWSQQAMRHEDHATINKIEKTVHRFEEDLTEHLADAKIHYSETHTHCMAATDGVCSVCGNIN